MTAAEFLKKLRAAVNAESKRHHKQSNAPQAWAPIKDKQFNELLTNNNEFSIEEINGALAAISELDASNEIFNNLQATLIESIETPGKEIMWFPDRDWELSTPWSEIIIGGGITEEIGTSRWSSFQDKYLPITNGRFQLPDNFSPTKGADLELDKEIIRDIQSKAKLIQDALEQNYLAQLRINPNATDDEIFRSLLLEGPSGLLESDVSGISTGSLLDYLPELIMPQTLEDYQGGATGGRFPDDAPSWLTEDKTVDPNTGKTTYGKQYYAGTATHPHMVVDRQGQRTYYDKDWSQIAPPREDVGPVAFEPDSRYFERDPLTGEWKLNEALSNLPLGQQAQFDNRFKLAEEAMSNIQKGGQLGINFAAQDLKGREYLDDMLRDPGMSFARMANFRGDPQWKGGRFGGVSPADRFNDYQNYYGGLNKQLRDLYGLQGLFNPPPAGSPSITPPAGSPSITPPATPTTPSGPSGPTGPAGPGVDIGAGDGFKPPEQVIVPSTPPFVPPPIDPNPGPTNPPRPPFVPIPANPLPGGTNPPIPPAATLPPSAGPGTGPNALPDPNVPNPSTAASFTSPGPPPPNQVPGFEYPGSRPPPGFGMDTGNIRSQAIQPLIPTPAVPPPSTATQQSLVENAMSRLPGFGSSLGGIGPAVAGGAGIGQKVPEMVTDIKETITDIDVPKFIDLPEVTWSGPRFSMPSMPSFNMPNILDSRIVNTIQGQGGRNIERDRRRRAAERASRNTLANAQRGRRGSFG